MRLWIGLRLFNSGVRGRSEGEDAKRGLFSGFFTLTGHNPVPSHPAWMFLLVMLSLRAIS